MVHLQVIEVRNQRIDGVPVTGSPGTTRTVSSGSIRIHMQHSNSHVHVISNVLLHANPHFGMTMIKKLRPVLAWHGSHGNQCLE